MLTSGKTGTHNVPVFGAEYRPRATGRPGYGWGGGLAGRQPLVSTSTGLPGGYNSTGGCAWIRRAHESAFTCLQQKLCIDQRAKQSVAGRPVQSPQPLCLRRRQTEPWHLVVFAPDATKDVVGPLLCCHQRYSGCSRCGGKGLSNPCARGGSRALRGQEKKGGGIREEDVRTPCGAVMKPFTADATVRLRFRFF